jgi:hypothetical protein
MKTSTTKVLRSILRGPLAAPALAVLLVNPALAQNTVRLTPVFSSTPLTQFATPLPAAPNPVGTTFTSYNGSGAEYALGTFTVGSSRVYSATITSPSGTPNGLEILIGTFSPSASPAPMTPVANLIVRIQSPSVSAIPSLTLTAGTQYSYLLLLKQAYAGSATFTLSGPGAITLGNNAAVPALNPLAIAALSGLLAGMAARMLARWASAH